VRVMVGCARGEFSDRVFRLPHNLLIFRATAAKKVFPSRSERGKCPPPPPRPGPLFRKPRPVKQHDDALNPQLLRHSCFDPRRPHRLSGSAPRSACSEVRGFQENKCQAFQRPQLPPAAGQRPEPGAATGIGGEQLGRGLPGQAAHGQPAPGPLHPAQISTERTRLTRNA
jgi:hypothetical protein